MKITQRGPDTFLLSWELGTGPDGKRKQRTETFHSGILEAPSGKSLQDVRRKAAENYWTVERARMIQGTSVDPDKITVAELCDRWWRDVFLPRKRAAQTEAQYESTIRLHIKPAIGGLRVQKLKTMDVQQMIAEMPRKDGRAGEPSPRQKALVLWLTRQILRQAVIWQIVHRNVAEFAEAPKQRRKEIRYWRTEDVERFLVAASGHRLYALFGVALSSGMRIGELLGLKRDAIDWHTGCLQVTEGLTQVNGRMVNGAPKTDRSMRAIALGPATMEMLAAHLKRMDAEREALGSDWHENGLVFPSEVGTPISETNARRTLDGILKRAGIRRVTPHGMRHTHATQLLAHGVLPHVVSERLGHAKVSFTEQVYAHTLPHQQEQAAKVLDVGEQGHNSGNKPPLPPRS